MWLICFANDFLDLIFGKIMKTRDRVNGRNASEGLLKAWSVTEYSIAMHASSRTGTLAASLIFAYTLFIHLPFFPVPSVIKCCVIWVFYL